MKKKQHFSILRILSNAYLKTSLNHKQHRDIFEKWLTLMTLIAANSPIQETTGCLTLLV